MSRYDGLRNLSRNQALREYAEAHPGLSGREIGLVFLKENGKPLSRQRVWAILKKEGK
mgnify:CR=1 FL=1